MPARAAWVCAGGVFAATLIVYVFTLAPTVVDQDSGELVAAAHVLGVPHPTGYPLWTLLARGFDLLPVGHTSGYRVALLSAVSTAGAAALLCRLTISMTGLLLPGVFAGLAFGLWFPTWSQAVRPEVYALGGLLFVLSLLAVRRWDGDRTARNLGWMAVAAGFAAMHHRTAFLALAPVLVTALLLTRPRRARTVALAAALFLAPFVWYAYLPIRAAADPPLNWGRPDTLDRFLYHASGRQYGLFALANSLDTVMQQIARLWGEVLAGDGWMSVVVALVGLPLIAWGLGSLWRRERAMAVSLAAGALLLSLWVLWYGEVSDSKVWLIPVGAVAALFGGVGLAKALSLGAEHRAGRLVGTVLGMVLCLGLLVANRPRSDLSNVWLYRDRWAAVLSQMPERAIFLAEFDVPEFATLYLQQVEDLRTDIMLIRPQALWYPWYVDSLPDAELGSVAGELWRKVNSEIDIEVSNTPEFWQGTARLAHLLGQHYGERRGVYALHGPTLTPIEPPPYFLALSEDLVRMTDDLPADLIQRSHHQDQVLVEFPNGLRLVSFEMGECDGHAGEMVSFRARWITAAPLSGELFGVRLRPADIGELDTGGAQVARWDRLAGKGRFVQGFPVVYGLRGLAASPRGTIYEQECRFIVPTNTPSGDYAVEIGFAPSYPPEYEQWTRLGAENTVAVHSRPLPTNEP